MFFTAEGAPKAGGARKGQSLGGWSLVNNNTPSMMSEKDSTRINTALKDQMSDFKVIDLVATQVVSGAIQRRRDSKELFLC